MGQSRHMLEFGLPCIYMTTALSSYPQKQGLLYSSHRKKLSMHLYESWVDRYFYLSGTNLVYFLEGIDEKPRNRIPLTNAVIEGIFFRDDLFVITIRCSKEHVSFYTLGHEDEHEIKDWFDQLKRAIELSNKQLKVSRAPVVLEDHDLTAQDSMSSEELAVPTSPGLLEVYEEVMKCVNTIPTTDWKAVALKNNCVIRVSTTDPTLMQFSVTLKNTPISLVYNALLVPSTQICEDYPTWNTWIEASRTVMNVSNCMDLVSMRFRSSWFSRPKTALLARHFSCVSKSGIIIARSCENEESSINVEMCGFYMKHREDSTQLQAFFRLRPLGLALFRDYLSLKFSSSFSKVVHHLTLAPIMRDEPLPQDVDGVIRRLSVATSLVPVEFNQLTVKNLDTGKEFLMSYEGIEEEEKKQILQSVMTECFGYRKDLTFSQEEALQLMKEKFPGETEQTLCRFLKARDFKVAKSERLLTRALEWRDRVHPESITLVDIAAELKRGFVIRHYYDKFRRPALILRAARYYPRQIRVEDAERLILYLLESGIKEMTPDVRGFCMVADMKDVGLVNFSFPHFKHFAHLIQEFYPERLGSAFIINVSWVVKSMWVTAKPLLNQRTIDKIHFMETKEMRKLLDVFDENVLPVEYGGKAQSIA